MLVTSGAEVAGAVVSLPFLVAPGLVVVFLLVLVLVLVVGFGGGGRVLAGGEGDGGVTLGLEVLLVLDSRSSQMASESTSLTAAPSGRMRLSVGRGHRQLGQSRATASPKGTSVWFTEAADRSLRHSGLPWSLPLPVAETWQVMRMSRVDPRGTSGVKSEPSMTWRSSSRVEDMSAGYARALTVCRSICSLHPAVTRDARAILIARTGILGTSLLGRRQRVMRIGLGRKRGARSTLR
ncbi:hypothetical protein AB0G98_25120 [Streptomyces sp. NPDC020196]|uniref:hypothetical protein n=1 Tax=Streptomyces sp. NPDC020196 TaxID=3156656 RepID=UPI0033ED0359